MAKVYKATIYITDIDDEYENQEDFTAGLKYVLVRMLDMNVHISETEVSEEFEWEDELKINMVDSTNDDFEEYFKQ